MKLVIESKLLATEKQLGEIYLPRITRLCRKFKFNENETKIATFCLVTQSGYGENNGMLNPVICCKILNIPLKEMLEFLDKDRLHMEQGFFSEILDSYILSSGITYDNDFCKALMGTHLKSQEFLKIEQTKLADVIAEEPGNDKYR